MRNASVAFLLLCSSAFAETITLSTSGEWHDQAVWDLGRVPVQADDVVIPAGMDCTIEPRGLVACRTFDVSGTLVLDRETLVLGSDDPAVDVDCWIDGRVELQDQGIEGWLARMVPDGGWVWFRGSGEIYASRASGEEYQGRL